MAIEESGVAFYEHRDLRSKAQPSAAIADRVGVHRLRGVKCCSHAAARCRDTMTPLGLAGSRDTP